MTLYKIWSQLKKSKKSLMLQVPNTLIVGYGFKNLAYMYTDNKGQLQFLENIDVVAFKSLFAGEVCG